MVMIENYLILGLKRFNCAGSLRGAHARVPACACTRVYSRATRDRGRNAGEGSEAANEGGRGEAANEGGRKREGGREGGKGETEGGRKGGRE